MTFQKEFHFREGLISANNTLYPRYSTKEYISEGVTITADVFKVLPQMNRIELLLFYYYLDKMSDFNIVKTDEEYRKNFIDYLVKSGHKGVVDVTVRKAITTIVKLNLMVKIRRGRYRINPFLVFKSILKDKERVKLLRTFMVETGEVEEETSEYNPIQEVK